MTSRSIFPKVLVGILMSMFVICSFLFSTLEVDADMLRTDDFVYVDTEKTEAENPKETENEKNEQKKQEKSSSWDVAFWVGSAGCLVLAVFLAIRSGNKKYGKD